MNPFERELRALLDVECQRVAEILVSGIAIQTMEQYREKIGELNALRQVYELCGMAAENASKR